MNYIGSKHSLLNFLHESIEKVSHSNSLENKPTFIDGFAGTGAVGLSYKKKDYSVIANDIQYYSFVVNKGKLFTLTKKNKIKLGKIINQLNTLNIPNNSEISELSDFFVYKNYCPTGSEEKNRMYFTDENGKKCDAIRIELNNLKYSGKITEPEFFYILWCLLEAIDKVANTASVYGAYLKKFKKSALKSIHLKLLETDFIENVETLNLLENFVYNTSIEKLLENPEFIITTKNNILYLDPPYNQRQYAPNYHVLETIAKYDYPELRGKTGLRNYTEQKSEFCSKRTVYSALTHILENTVKNRKNNKIKYIFLSYNNEGLMSPESIQEIFESFGKYSIFTKEYGRFKADKTENRNHTASSVVEYLHCVILD
ncbi:TPA: DNA adenine methylase [Candidatus Gracilibacteria bacterium]|nr:DNA adenine methylase [Candidatus Gracilibacteria bacterium]HIQ57533.1 DNA adenine methylase [Candidatus Gracilibacteria bacterium]